MTHPGLAVMLMVGVGLGAVLYYFFASTSEQVPGPGHRRTRNHFNRTDDYSNGRLCWPGAADSRNRRPDNTVCSICLETADKEDAVRLVPCMHVFHKLCIEEWRIHGTGDARNSCPICRDKIMGLEEL